MIFDGEITGGPATSPTLYLPSGQTDRLGRLVVSQGGLLMKQQHQPKALDDLDRHGSAGHGVEGLLHEIVREGTKSGPWSWHSGILSLPGFFGESTSFYQKSVETTTLFVKRTTKFLLNPRPLAVRPEELRAIRRAFPILVRVGEDSCMAVDKPGWHPQRRSLCQPVTGRKPRLHQLHAPNGGYLTYQAPLGGLPNTTAYGRG